MPTKKAIIAITLNVLFGGAGYIYIKEPTRVPLAIFLIFVTVYEFIRNLFVISNPATANDPAAIHTLPMLSLFGSIPGVVLLVIMAIDVHLLVKQSTPPKPSSKNNTLASADTLHRT